MLTKSIPAGSSDGAAGDFGAGGGSVAGAEDGSGDSFFAEPVLPAADAVEFVPDVSDSEAALTAAESRAVRVPAEEDVVLSMEPDPEFVAAAFPQPARSARAEQSARTVFPACFIFFMRVSFMSVTESLSIFLQYAFREGSFRQTGSALFYSSSCNTRDCCYKDGHET